MGVSPGGREKRPMLLPLGANPKDFPPGDNCSFPLLQCAPNCFLRDRTEKGWGHQGGLDVLAPWCFPQVVCLVLAALVLASLPRLRQALCTGSKQRRLAVMKKRQSAWLRDSPEHPTVKKKRSKTRRISRNAPGAIPLKTDQKKKINRKHRKTPLHQSSSRRNLPSSKLPKRATTLGQATVGAQTSPPRSVTPHKRTSLNHALHVRALGARVCGAQVADEVVAAVVHVARLGLCAAVDAAAEGEAARVGDALVALELLAGGEGGGAEVAGELVVLGDLVVSGGLVGVSGVVFFFKVCLCFFFSFFLEFVCLCLCWGGSF